MSAPGRFNLSAWTLRHQALVTFVLVLVTLLGVLSYRRLSQSEDPPFTFKVMVIQTSWPGATARQVQEQVTDRIARKLQETPNVDFQRSYSRPGESLLFFTMKDSAPASEVPKTWYQVRKKVGDIAATLPDGVQGPYFNDEFGDVYTNIYTLGGDGFTPGQLHDYADELRAELLRVPGVAKVDYFGDQTQRIFIEISNSQLTRLGITPRQLGDVLGSQNAVASTGVLTTADDRVYIRASGQYTSLSALADTLVRINNHSFRLGDIAKITRGYDDPPSQQMRSGGQAVLGIGVTMQPGGDVVHLGQALDKEVARLSTQLPAGLKLDQVSSMPHAVEHSVDDFLEAVAEAIAIVLVVSLVSLGLRTGMVVVISIPIVLAVTALFMDEFGIGLDKVSLGTLVLALGLLVDDAIIAVEMMAVKLEQGWDRTRAAAFAYTSTAFPMLTGTLVTVSGFLPIALAKSGTGEYTRSIFEVSAIALLLSWLAAVVLIPMLGFRLLKEKPQPEPVSNAAGTLQPADHDALDDPGGHDHAIYQTRAYQRLRRVVGWCVTYRIRVVALTAGLFVAALAAFGLVPQQFFPSSDRPELLVDLRLPERASFAATLREAQRLEAALKDRPEIDHLIDFVGTGAPRFYLPLDQQLANPNFAQFVITAKSVPDREKLAHVLEGLLPDQFGNLRTRVTRLENGPPVGFPVQFRVSAAQIPQARAAAEQAAAVMRQDSRVRNLQFDWDEPAERSVSFEVDQQRARDLGVSSQDIASFLAMTLSGYTVTQYRERDKLISVQLRAPLRERVDPAHLLSLAMPTANGAVPLSSLGHLNNQLEYGVIWERDRQPTITVQADVSAGAQGIDVTNALNSRLDGLRAHLPPGVRIEVGGPVEENAKAQASISAAMPLMLIAVFTLLMIQLQSFGRVMMVVLTAPLGLIGVVSALLLFGQPFGFVAMLGTIAMLGIIMRNSVILVDQIEQDIAAGRGRFDAIVGATVRRFRPITLTAAAAVLALIPLLRSNFFGPMATALMGGITIATVLTLFYLPALYALCFRVKPQETGGPPAGGSAPGSGPGPGGADHPGRAAPAAVPKGLALAVLATALSACSFGPHDKLVAPQTAHYGEQPLPAQTQSAAGVAQHFALGARPVPQWWLAYRSPALNAMVEEGLRNNYSLAATAKSLAAAHEQLRAQIGESLLPTVDLGGTVSRQRALSVPIAGQKSNLLYNVFEGEISTSYTFDLFGAARYANSELAAQIDVQSYQRDATRRALAASVVTAALNAAVLHAQIALTERLVALGDTDAAQAQRRYQLGSLGRDDSLAQAASSASLRASLPGLRAQWQAQRHALAVLMGRTPDAAPPDLDLNAVQLPDPVPVAIPSELLKQRPDILAAEAAVKASAAGVAVATAQMYPSLTISAAYGQGGFTWAAATGGAGLLWNAGVSLSQPLFHGGALRARRRAAQDSYEAAVANYKQTVLSAFQNVADTLSALTHDAQTLSEAGDAAQYDRQIWRNSEQRAALGAIAPDTVRASERQYQNQRLSEVRARGARLVDTVALYQAMGQLPPAASE